MAYSEYVNTAVRELQNGGGSVSTQTLQDLIQEAQLHRMLRRDECSQCLI